MNKIKELRIQNNLTQAVLAQRLGTKRNTLCDWELDRTEPNIYYIKKLAETFNVSINYLLDLESENYLDDYLQVKIINTILNKSECEQQIIFNLLTNLKELEKC